MKSDITLTLVHATKNRMRFAYKIRRGQKIAPIPLRIALESIEGVSHVRINAILCQIILHANLDRATLEERLYQVLQALLVAGDSQHEESYLTLRDEIPSASDVVRALTALCLEPFLKAPAVKLALACVAAFPVLASGCKELVGHGITSRVLEALAIAISLTRNDFRTANATNFMLCLGEYIEEMTMYKSDDLIKELSKPNVKEAWIERNINGQLTRELVACDSLGIGDIVIIGAGNTICVDGHVVSGVATVNQISMTGEATPVQKEHGDRVLSGTIVVDGEIKVWAENVGDQTASARIRSYIQSSLTQKSAITLGASKMADGLVPITLGLAILSYLYSRDITRAASVLQADYSCALKLATPVAFKAAIGSAGKSGIIIKGAKALEGLFESDVFVFDKTGTLTKGDLQVVKVHSFSADWDSNAILNLAASIEEHYVHPVAQAVVRAAKEHDFVHVHHEEVAFIVAHGVSSKVLGKKIVIGSQHFLEEDEGICFAPNQERIEALKATGNMPLYIGYDGTLIGMILLKDVLRENAKDVLLQLRENGVREIIMLTGDSETKAAQIADELGIDRYYAALLPTQKAEILEQIMHEGRKVTFIGDGINDAPALLKAHVGIGMHKGADIAKASADIVLLRDELQHVADAKAFGVACLSRIRTNFRATVGVNSAILGLATFGKLTPIQTAFLHNGTTILLLLNALRAVKLERQSRFATS